MRGAMPERPTSWRIPIPAMISTVAATERQRTQRCGSASSEEASSADAVEAAAPLGIDIVLVDPSTDLPPLEHGERVATAFDDPLAVEVLSRCDVVTVELEGVPVEVLEKLRAVTDVAPPPAAVAVSQDRLVEKRSLHLDRHPDRALRRCRRGRQLPPSDDVIVKSRRGGYDGRGQVVVRAGDAIDGRRRDRRGSRLL